MLNLDELEFIRPKRVSKEVFLRIKEKKKGR